MRRDRVNTEGARPRVAHLYPSRHLWPTVIPRQEGRTLSMLLLRKGVLLERTYIHSRRLPLGLPAARDPMSRETPISLAPPSPTHVPWPASIYPPREAGSGPADRVHITLAYLLVWFIRYTSRFHQSSLRRGRRSQSYRPQHCTQPLRCAFTRWKRKACAYLNNVHVPHEYGTSDIRARYATPTTLALRTRYTLSLRAYAHVTRPRYRSKQ